MRKVILGAVALGLSFTAQAFDWLEHSEAILREASQQRAHEWLQPPALSPESQRIAEEITQSGVQILNAVESAKRQQMDDYLREHDLAPDAETDRPIVLVSFAIPEPNLKAIFEEAFEQNAILAFRGVPAGKSIVHLRDLALKYVSAPSKLPTVVINPIVFQELRTLEVPTAAYPVGDGGYATMRGLVNIDWMRRKLASMDQSPTLDLGYHGQTWTASEPDLIEEIKRRVLAVDWDVAKQKAIDTFWSKRQYYDLPQATADASFSFDPTVVLPQDILDSNGTVVLRRGTAVNPLHRMPLTKRYIFFDARKKGQIEIAERLKREAWDEGRGAVLIMTNFDAESGWDGFEALNIQFKAPVFLLNNQIKERFRLRALPAMAYAVGDRIEVLEFGVQN